MILYILDDDPTELSLWNWVFNDLYSDKCVLASFDNFDKFKKAFTKQVPDICVIDFIMPFHSGTEVCKWVRENHPEVRLYVNTSLIEDEYQVLSERLGATFLSKEKMTIEERLEVIANGCKS